MVLDNRTPLLRCYLRSSLAFCAPFLLWSWKPLKTYCVVTNSAVIMEQPPGLKKVPKSAVPWVWLQKWVKPCVKMPNLTAEINLLASRSKKIFLYSKFPPSWQLYMGSFFLTSFKVTGVAALTDTWMGFHCRRLLCRVCALFLTSDYKKPMMVMAIIKKQNKKGALKTNEHHHSGFFHLSHTA